MEQDKVCPSCKNKVTEDQLFQCNDCDTIFCLTNCIMKNYNSVKVKDVTNPRCINLNCKSENTTSLMDNA